ncbi:hypothetical protein [Marinobacter qingdaonensis]|uniref:Uncharacterized protein n=1 Tax=Marinobacter qingdaonensis TaxID=3108486 RepID=A0ABU5NY92_9GAMM|nr:hypothetical protein [Marinobacter sp. ASW11-75]MEA1080758.1 hypothetical protein [Marinobacter sp. ASW11-75]
MKGVAMGVLLFLLCAYSHAEDVLEGKLKLAGFQVEVWGDYEISHMLFPDETWKFKVLVVPVTVRQGDLIDIAKSFYKKYPRTRARFFSDKQHLQQFVERDIYVNDRSGTAKEVAFPDSKWVQNNLLGNINNRSEKYNRTWMLENRYGSRIVLLE